MATSDLPTGGEFRARFIAGTLVSAAATTLLISVYLTALIRLPSEQWWGFGQMVAALFVPLFAVQDRVNRRLWGPVALCLDRLHAGELSRDELRRGFEAAVNMPVRGQRIGLFWWVLGGVLIACAMKLRFDSFPGFSFWVLIAAATTGGFVMTVFTFFVTKRLCAPVRHALAFRLEDPEERRELAASSPLRGKLRFAITGVTVATVTFAVFCAHVRSMRPVAVHAVALQTRFLAEVEDRLAGEGPAALAVLAGQAARLGIASELALYDPVSETVIAGALDSVLPGELALIRTTAPEVVDSLGFDSPHLMSWRRLEDGTVLIAASGWTALAGAMQESSVVFLVLLLAATGIAMAFSHLLANDVSRATEHLRREADRLASGDLRRGEVFESEDELGELSRAFDRMAGSLRSTIGGVAKAADRVEATSAEMATVASNVFSVTADQVAGIQHTSRSMETISAQVRGIADSAQSLNGSVEEASSSILELGAAGDELNETAGLMSAGATDVSSSIEQMVQSVKQVLENTETLAAAAVETSSSMGEMATSMREVDSSAEETARLSREVVESAEQGQAKMVQTIQGMDAIREATETAEGVIRSLGSRASEIGAIVDVIDDVADETSLLALNAAIIAAQAGEHGKAFSVVADEIKDLADRVLSSTKEIGSQIRAVQDESARAMAAIEQGSSIVAEGVDVTAEAGGSLEEITRASRESGDRISRILTAVREQAGAASHVVELMERVRGGVDEIQRAASEQDRGNEVVHRGSVAMRDVAAQVRGTTEEQSRGSGRIRESIEGVRDAVEQIHAALQEQSRSCRSAAEFLGVMHTRTQSNEESASRLEEVVRELSAQAECLRADVGRFRI